VKREGTCGWLYSTGGCGGGRDKRIGVHAGVIAARRGGMGNRRGNTKVRRRGRWDTEFCV